MKISIPKFRGLRLMSVKIPTPDYAISSHYSVPVFNYILNFPFSHYQEVQLEKDTLQESLNEATGKLAETKIKLENEQYRASTNQSEISSKLTKSIESLKCEVENCNKKIAQKDATIAESAKKLETLRTYIQSAEADFLSKTEKMEKLIGTLQKELKELHSGKDRLNELIAEYGGNEGADLVGSVKKILDEKNARISKLERDNNGNSLYLKNRMNITETLETYSDYSDNIRHAASVDLSMSPHYLSSGSTTKKVRWEK